ncbi:class I SAM-dependent methyltransferase [Amycolatopsis anabasis]|uniref:class I SAM-dependent methyltransferase n=1 Tax=Amycolatopsis anabasis TaxID=1840409 RepID=UPI00131E57D5|nr:class I SAM-dependent methyltransferase [Amycolatopsis anabasis]
MTEGKVDFTGVKWGSVEWTMLCTLYLRAYESRSNHSILGDHAAAEAMDRIDYDFDRMKSLRPSSNQFLVALRAKQLDVWATDFLARHPDAIVLHLGCGLDSRAFRLDLPAGVDWFDVDVPTVVELRRQVYSEHDRYQMIGSSVTDPEWLDRIPADRPVLVVAEGLLPYLTENEVRQLLQRLTDRFPTGELMFDGIPPWGAKVMKIFRWGIRDGHQLEQWNPRLRFLEKASIFSHFAEIPARGIRAVYRLTNAIPACRNFSRMYRFGF